MYVSTKRSELENISTPSLPYAIEKYRYSHACLQFHSVRQQAVLVVLNLIIKGNEKVHAYYMELPIVLLLLYPIYYHNQRAIPNRRNWKFPYLNVLIHTVFPKLTYQHVIPEHASTRLNSPRIECCIPIDVLLHTIRLKASLSIIANLQPNNITM